MMFPTNPMGEFGDKFRKAREKKELSLDDVSQVTKIGSRMLQAIEEERFDVLPGGVFNKGFIRAYAKHLGLNSEEAVTEYLACLRQAQVDAYNQWQPDKPLPPAAAPEKIPSAKPLKPAARPQPAIKVVETPAVPKPRPEEPPPPLINLAAAPSREMPWRIIIVAVVVILLTAILGTRRTQTAGGHTANTPTSDPAPATAPAPVVSNPVSTALPAQSQPPMQPAPKTSAPSAQNQPAPATLSNAASKPEDDAKETGADDVTVQNFGSAPAKAALNEPTRLILIIRASENSSVSIVADGRQVASETLIAPAHTSVRASREIVARIGNTAGVTFLFDGHEIFPDGAEGESKTFVFDANGMRVVP
jgi:cytoskeletal protein RodZ